MISHCQKRKKRNHQNQRINKIQEIRVQIKTTLCRRTNTNKYPKPIKKHKNPKGISSLNSPKQSRIKKSQIQKTKKYQNDDFLQYFSMRLENGTKYSPIPKQVNSNHNKKEYSHRVYPNTPSQITWIWIQLSKV